MPQTIGECLRWTVRQAVRYRAWLLLPLWVILAVVIIMVVLIGNSYLPVIYLAY